MSEKLYWEILKTINLINDHPWSRRISREDSEAIALLRKRLTRLANEMYRELHPTQTAARPQE